MGLLPLNPRNLQTLGTEIDKRTGIVQVQRNRLIENIRSVFSTLGLDDALKRFRSAFLKLGGANLNEVLKGLVPDSTSGFEFFQAATDPDRFLPSKGLVGGLTVLEWLVGHLRKALGEPACSSFFYPMRDYEALVDRLRLALEKTQADRNRLDQMNGILETMFGTVHLLERKHAEYVGLRHAVRVEFWKADGQKVFLNIIAGTHNRPGLAEKVDELLSVGRQLARVLDGQETGQVVEDPLGLRDSINCQLQVLEKYKLTALSQQTLGIIEGVKLMEGGLTPAARAQGTLEYLERDVSPDPAVFLTSTFERFQEEEIRLTAENRVLTGRQGMK